MTVEAGLLTKIRRLNESVWEHRAGKPAIDDWLGNFAPTTGAGPDERLQALYLLSNFMYFGAVQIRALLKAVFRDLYKYPIIEAIRKADNDTLDETVIDERFRNELRHTRFLGVGNPSESGCHLLYFFRQENQLSKKVFIHAHEMFTRDRTTGAVSIRDATITRYVFLDDFCGSGDQGKSYSQELLTELRRLSPNAKAVYYVLFASSNGLQKLRTELNPAFDAVECVFELDESFKAFSASSRYFVINTLGVDKAIARTMCETYGQRLVGLPDALGYNDGQLLIGFHHNTPDNTLPVIWYDEHGGPPWVPLFRRYPKVYGWQH